MHTHETNQVLSQREQDKAMKIQTMQAAGNSNSASAWDVLRLVVAEAESALSTLAFGQLPGFLSSPQVRAEIKFDIFNMFIQERVKLVLGGYDWYGCGGAPSPPAPPPPSRRRTSGDVPRNLHE